MDSEPDRAIVLAILADEALEGDVIILSPGQRVVEYSVTVTRRCHQPHTAVRGRLN
jgi:hypothetical protein